VDCLSTTTGHGLPQMVKQGNLFLNLFWTIFFLIGLAGAVYMIYFAVNQFLQFGVITTTKIKNEKEMILPGLTICGEKETKLEEIVFYCVTREASLTTNGTTCDITHVTIMSKLTQYNCLQVNFGKNKEKLAKVVSEGEKIGFELLIYFANYYQLKFGISDNSARVVFDDVYKYLYPGVSTEIALSKTNQIALGPPYSDCNDSVDYRKVTCIDDCYNKNISEYCGCKWSSVSCEDECKQNITQILARLDSIKSQCRLECPVECNQVTFSLDRLDLPLNEDDFTRNSELKVIPPNYRINSTILTIYYERLETTEITQSESISLISLIANVGGLLGNLEFIFLSTLIFNHLNLNKYLLFFLS